MMPHIKPLKALPPFGNAGGVPTNTGQLCVAGGGQAMASDCRKANGYSKGSLLMLELGVMECARGPNIKSTAVKKRLLPDHK